MSVRLIIEKLSKINNLFSPNELKTSWQNVERYQIKTRNDKITVMFPKLVCQTDDNDETYRLI